MIKTLKLFFIAGFLITLIFAVTASSQETVSVDGARIDDDSSMLQSLVIVTEGAVLKYSIAGKYESGLNVVEVVAEDRLINHRQCYAATDCSVSGVHTLQSDKPVVLTVVIIGEDGKQQSERIKVRPTSTSKVYFIGTAPGIQGMQLSSQEELADATGTEKLPSSGNADREVRLPEAYVVASEGPVLNVDVKQESENEYAFSVVSKDAAGIEFIEILENGSFMDVEICGGRTKCEYKKVVKNKKPGRNKYMIKSMNMAGSLTFQEQLLFFTEPAE